MADADKNLFNKIITGGETLWFAYDPEKKRQSSEWVGEIFPRPKKLKFRKSHFKIMLINFFDSQGIMHKEFTPQGKSINAEFCKGVMCRHLKRIQRVRPAAFCSQDFSCCTIMHLPTKLEVFANFWPQKCCNPLSPTPVLSKFISARLFSIPQVENDVTSTPFYGCCWDPSSRNWWIKEGPKRGIFGSFSETVRPCKSLYICHWTLFWIKESMCLRSLKKSVLKRLDRTV